MTNQIITFGCRLNTVESELIKQAVEKSGEENLIVFNSCAVTSAAERDLRIAIRKTHKENPTAKIVVTGCAAQIDPTKYAKMAEVGLVLGNQEKSESVNYSASKTDSKEEKLGREEINTNQNPEILHKDKIFKNSQNQLFDPALQEKIRVNDIMSIRDTAEHMILDFEGRSRAFVQIQNGCNHRCTFCIIPYGRGNSRSVGFGQIVEQIKQLVNNGYREIVLTGVDATDYGKDLIGGLTLSKMVKRLLKLVPELPRLRLSSVDVAEIDDEMIDIIKTEKRFMPYLHISLQSGDDIILKRMKRRHSRQQVLDFCKKVREIRPEVTFGSDIIAGFPTESDEMFSNSLNLILEAGLIFNHIFPYSIREGTPAAKMPQIDGKLKKDRAKQLRDATAKELDKFLKTMIGTTQNILLENNNIGRCENFIQVQLDKIPEGVNIGEIFTRKIIGAENGKLISC
ncbi:MAG: threonylcarbamoyladenosine tRNA methylthiotransferase MtaB [Rickettsiales bacterium]|jgi:threonylcarbamoyladenosine tRNA methylthiotransferase MtaB